MAKSILSKNFLLTTWLGMFIDIGFLSFYTVLDSANRTKFVWDVLILSLIVGTLILTMNTSGLSKKKKEYMPRLGFATILSGLLILIGHGIYAFVGPLLGLILDEAISVGAIFTIAVFPFSLMLSSVVLEFVDELYIP